MGRHRNNLLWVGLLYCWRQHLEYRHRQVQYVDYQLEYPWHNHSLIKWFLTSNPFKNAGFYKTVTDLRGAVAWWDDSSSSSLLIFWTQKVNLISYLAGFSHKFLRILLCYGSCYYFPQCSSRKKTSYRARYRMSRLSVDVVVLYCSVLQLQVSPNISWELELEHQGAQYSPHRFR